ncbi:sugar porter family MFS transporter [Salidesulfovibrio brasiliensis]|uniref:sugar porter family MFS transporter n=1 Tax=Salidesulfovibrio brasiliensis TaxID=221711 RepID=UPI001C49269E|nr:sugar porter family MFS transporter [Salidesulfovibrio brasiliensis]
MAGQSSRSEAGMVYVVVISTVSALAGLLFGFDTGVIAGALEPLAHHFAVQSEFTKELIVAAVTLGALGGAICSGKASSRLGRKHSIILSALLFIAGTLCTSLAQSVLMVVAGRLVMGFAVGLSAMVVPMYLSEVSPPSIRGGVVFTFQLAITIGIFAAYVINSIYAENENWRWMFGVGILPALLLFFGMLRLPESPRWLVLKNRTEEARRVLLKIMAVEKTEAALNSIKESVQHPQGGLRELFSKRFLPLVAIAFTLFVLQQLSGINTIFYYAPTVFKEAGFSDPVMVSLLPASVNVASTVLGIWVVDRLGRRGLAYIGFAGMAVCLILLGADLNGMVGGHGPEPLVSLVSVLCYIFFFAISLGGVPYIVMSELFPLTLRSVGMATASCANWGFNFLVSLTFLTLSSTLGMGTTFWLYACFMVLGLVFTYLFLPETKGRRLEDIEANLYAGKRPRNLGDPVQQ